MPLIGAADASDNSAHIAVLIGNEDAIRRCHALIGRPTIHMRREHGRRQKESIVRSIVFSDAMFSVCLWIDRPSIIKKLKIEAATYKARQSINLHINYAIKNKMHEYLDSFMNESGSRLEDIEFEIDADLYQTFRSVGLRTRSKGIAHQLTDAIGWANMAKIPIAGVLDKDIRDYVETYVRKRMG